MKKTIYIHIGMPKTGSSAIQAFLTLNYNKLLKKGVFFPNPPKFDHAFQTTIGNAAILRKLFENNEVDEVRKYIEKFKDKDTIIFSSEYLYDILRESPERFFDVFNKYDYKIICYVRRQDNLLSSLYNQYIKNHYGTVRSIGKVFDFSKTLLGSLEYTEPDKIIVRPYEKQQFYGGSIFSDFLNCIGLKLEDDFILPEKVVNPSLDRDALEFRRILNILEVDKGNFVKQHCINELLAKYTVDNNMGKPFQDNNIFPPKERIELINGHKKENELVAKVFLNRTDGKLFYDPTPQIRNNWNENKDLTFEKALDICKYLLSSKYGDNLEEELINIIAKGTVEKLLNSDYFINGVDDIKRKPLIYSLKSKPINISKDISIFERKLDFWYIESCGTDPHFIIPNFNEKGNDGEIIVKISITASSNTAMQLYYLSDNKSFDSNHCVNRNLKMGFNEIVINIKEKKNIKSLRLDPSIVEGFYLLHSFEVRGKK